MTSDTIARVDVPPAVCPGCGRKNGDHGLEPVGMSGWHIYIHIAHAPAVGCGNCGRIVYVTDAVIGRVKEHLRTKYPKVADRTVKFQKGK